MAPELKRIERLFWRARAWRALYLSVLFAEKSFVFFLAGGFLAALADWVAPLSTGGRRALWGFLLAGTVAAALATLRAWRGWRTRRIALDVGRRLRPGDGLLNAWELARRPPPAVSEELIRENLRRTAERLPELSPARDMRPPEWRGWAAAFGAALALSAAAFFWLPASGRAALLRVYYPFGADVIPGLLSVLPGDGRFPWGEDVAVRVKVSGPLEPEFWVQSGGLRWEKRGLHPGEEGEYRYLFQALREPVTYRFRLRGRWTPAYELTPFRPPRLESFRVRLESPAYAGRAAEVLENQPAWRVLRGARVLFEGRLDQPVPAAAGVFEDGRAVPVKVGGGRAVSFSWEAYESGELRLSWESPDPAAGPGEMRFQVEVLDDGPPRVRLLAPAQDLLLSPRERLPLVYEASDDFGVSQVFLKYSLNNGEEQSLPLKSFSRAEGGLPVQGLYDHVWALENLALNPGDRVRYRVTARDDNVLSGPGEGASASFTLQVASYEQDHRRLEEALEAVRRDMLSALAEQSLLRDALKGQSPDWAGLSRRQAAVKDALAGAANRLASAVEGLARDPLADQVMVAEHQAILESLRDLGQDAAPRAQAGLSAREADPAGRAMEEIVSELERLSLLSENVQKAAVMRNVLRDQEDLTQTARSLMDELSARPGGELSPEDRRKMQEMLSQMGRLMQAIARQIQNMPQALPEDFVNQEGVKALRWEEMASLMRETQRLMSQDPAAALEQMRKLVEELERMQKTLAQAANSLPGGPSWFSGPLREAMDRRRKELESLIDRQEKLKARAEVFSGKALARLLEDQKRLLKDMADEHNRRLRPNARGLLGQFSDSPAPGLWNAGSAALNQLRDSTDGLQKELEAAQVQKAPQLFQDILMQLDRLGALVKHTRARSPADAPRPGDAGLDRLAQQIQDLREGYNRLRDRLAWSPQEEELLSSMEKGDFALLAPEQEALRLETLAYRRDVQVLARDTAALGTRFLRRLLLAAEAMGQAHKEISEGRSRPAVQSQEEALRHLRDAQEGMRSADRQMETMPGAAGRPAGASIQPLGAQGASGARSGPVRLPKPEDFRPPREFREELLKSMKEKYPKSHEGTIQDYYDRWAE